MTQATESIEEPLTKKEEELTEVQPKLILDNDYPACVLHNILGSDAKAGMLFEIGVDMNFPAFSLSLMVDIQALRERINHINPLPGLPLIFPIGAHPIPFSYDDAAD